MSRTLTPDDSFSSHAHVALAGLQPAVANATSHLRNQCNLWITLSATAAWDLRPEA